jgi:Tfp pilus assembly protein PilZ
VNNKITEDHREFSRVDIKILATVQAKGEKIVSTGTHDISMKGLFVRGKADWSIGTECEIHLILEGQDPPVNIEVKGKVQRITEEGIAVLFTEVGLEAYEHLHNLVMLNTDDPEKVEREFSNHLGLKKK